MMYMLLEKSFYDFARIVIMSMFLLMKLLFSGTVSIYISLNQIIWPAHES